MARATVPNPSPKRPTRVGAASGRDSQACWTLAQVIQAYELNGPRDSHHAGARLLRNNASPRFLGTPIDEVSHEAFDRELRAYLGSEDRRRETGYRFVVDFNRLMQWAVARNYRIAPFESFPAPRSARPAPEPLLPAEVRRLLQILDDEFQHELGWRIVVRALVVLGLEIEEARHFTFAKAIELKGHYVLSDRKGRLRHIPIPKDMQVLIARALHDMGPEVGINPILKVSRNRLVQMVRHLGERVGLKELTPHRLKRTAVYGE